MFNALLGFVEATTTKKTLIITTLLNKTFMWKRIFKKLDFSYFFSQQQGGAMSIWLWILSMKLRNFTITKRMSEHFFPNQYMIELLVQ